MESTIGVSHHVGLSAFLISVVFVGFDPENLGVGVMAGAEASAGIALGTIVGTAMMALALVFGITALVVPLDPITRRFYLPVCAGTVLLVSALMWHRRVPRWGGALLLLFYALFVAGPSPV